MTPHRLSPSRRNLCRSIAAAPVAWLAACASVPPRVGEPPSYRLIDRLSWGANDVELSRATRLGAAGYRRSQLDGRGALPSAAQAQIDALGTLKTPLPVRLAEVDALRRAADAAVGEEPRKAAQDSLQRTLSLQARETATRDLLRALYAPTQLREQMGWFWFNHFNVHQHKATLRAMIGDYQESALRPQALGDFRAMLGAATRHPAMLRYLDNEHNTAGHGNENHARELLELHTLGVDGGYTQRDVQELARVLTGHGLNTGEKPRMRHELEALYQRDGVYEFNPDRHDAGTKTLFGHTLRRQGADELDEALDLIVAQPSCSRFVCHRIATFLIADDPPVALVERMAQAFRGRRIDAALNVLVHAPEFTEGPSKFKDPMHFVLSALRAAYDERVVLNTGPILGWLNRLGQGLYNRPTPDGYPLTAQDWNGSGQMAARFEVARAIGGGASGLFKPETDSGTMTEQPAFPQLARAAYYACVRDSLREETRVALAGAASPQDWNALYLSSPDFMVR